MYETAGFTEIFNSPYDDEAGHNGIKYKVLRRAKIGKADLEAMPLWLVEFENGERAFCYPEEISVVEQRK